MSDFALDNRLQADCKLLMTTDRCSYLLHRNAAVDWFIMVPHTAETEFYRLETALQHALCADINRVSSFIEAYFHADKINVATLGNVVSQMHIHVIGRHRNDPYWPDAVWGRPLQQQRSAADSQAIRDRFVAFMHQH